MKKIVAMLFFAAFVLMTTACREKETKTVIKEVEVEKTESTDESEGILERAAKEVDKEVNEEINEEIDKIGDDD